MFILVLPAHPHKKYTYISMRKVRVRDSERASERSVLADARKKSRSFWKAQIRPYNTCRVLMILFVVI